MASVLNILRPFGAFLRAKDVDIYNNVFKLHTKFSLMVLLAFSALVSTHEFFGKPIQCTSNRHSRDPYFDNYCWLHGTFTELPEVTSKTAGAGIAWGIRGVHFAAPGVAARNLTGSQRTVRVEHVYYQWVNMLLFAQALLCYVPAYMWKIWEHGHMQMLCRGFDTPLEPEGYQTRRPILLKYLLADNRRAHLVYAIRFFVCEALNVLCVALNMVLMDAVIGQFWTRYAPAVTAVLHGDRRAWQQSAADVFPLVAKCEYLEYGPSGTMENHDMMCVLSLNVLNEKIFVFLWLWMVVLMVVAAINALYRTATIASMRLRVRLLQAHAPTLSADEVMAASGEASLGEWFVLYQMARNVHANVLRDVLEELATQRRQRLQKQFSNGYA